MERSAFARARHFLNYTAGAKWTALVCSVLSAIVYIFLVLLLALFADLLVSQGKIPTYSALSSTQRQDYATVWNNLPPAERTEAIKHLGLNNPSLEQRLTATDVEPALAQDEQELRWRAYVWLLLRDRVNEEAANSYQPPAPISATPDETGERARALWAKSLSDQESARYGVLSPVVRFSYHWPGPILGWVASWNSWMWAPGDSGAPIPTTPQGMGHPNNSYLTGLLILAIVTVLARSLLLGITHFSATQATSEAMLRLRRAIYHHTYRQGTLTIRAMGPNEAISLFTRHVEAVHDGLYTWLTNSYRYPVQFFLLLAVALTLHVWLALTFVLGAIFVWMLAGQLAIMLRNRSRAASRKAANRLALLQESLMMMRLVKCYLMELFNQSRVERQLAEYGQASRQRNRNERNARGMVLTLASLGAVVLLYIAGRIVLAEGIGVATLVVLAVVLISLFFPIRGMLENRRFIRRGKESSAHVFEFLSRRGEVPQVVDAEFLQPMSKKLEFVNVSLREPGSGRMLLSDVNLKVRAGERICIVGSDDAELHALVYLIPRYLDPTSGEIRIDGRNIRWVTHDSLRSQMAVVLQHDLVFNDTVGNNIGCGDSQFTLPQIIEAAKIAHAHQFIQELPAGYETPIGELGQSLRVGEQFRIALARAILRDPALLIIEEPSALDRDTKVLFDDTMRRVLPNRTVIFLPHRESTVKAADRVFFIDQGKIEAVGEHRELVETNRLYKHLHYFEFNAFADRN